MRPSPSTPDHNPEDIAKGLRAEDDVDEIAKFCADLAKQRRALA